MHLLASPLVFAAVARIQNARRGKYQWVTPSADLVIEAYPRSSSTFLHRIVRAATDNRLRIAQHVHRGQQIKFGLKYQVPTLVLVRHPRDAIASHLVYDKRNTVDRCLLRYTRFARIVRDYLNHELLAVVSFEDVVSRPLDVSRRILSGIGAEFSVDEQLIQRATSDYRDDRSRSSLPNAHKQALKQAHYREIENHRDFTAAETLYFELHEVAWQF